jgi:hypothetical protein
MNRECWFYAKACILGDGSLTRIQRKNSSTVMISFTHSTKQKPWLEQKANRLNALMGRSCKVGERKSFDSRTGKTYGSCQFSLTSKELLPLYELAYPGKKKTFTEELLEGLTEEHLAVFWADDGNLEPVRRIGRLNLYEPEEQCLLVKRWITSVCGAVGRYEDYERQGVGRLRFPASEMIKIAMAIKPYLHPTMLYKIDMQYKNNTKAKALLTASSPNRITLDDIPSLESMTRTELNTLAKSLGVSYVKHGNNESVRKRIMDILVDDKNPRVQGTEQSVKI